MSYEPGSTKALSEVLFGIAADTGAALERVRRLIEPAPFSDPALIIVESNLLSIFDGVEEAVALLGAATRALLGPPAADEPKEVRG